MSAERKELPEHLNYELFILALSVLAVFNWVLFLLLSDEAVQQVILAVDLLLSMIFLVDFFFYRLRRAESKRDYFLRQYGWLDLLGSLPLPQFKIFRVARIIAAQRRLRQAGPGGIFRVFLSDRAGSAFFLVAFFFILVLEFGSLAVLAVEQDAPDANITTAGDALWWSLVTMSTVGYGDQVPVTRVGRMIGVLVIIVGVGLFGVITGFLTNRFLPDEREKKQFAAAAASSAESSAAIMQEIASLRQEHERAQVELEAKLDALMARLEEQRG